MLHKIRFWDPRFMVPFKSNTHIQKILVRCQFCLLIAFSLADMCDKDFTTERFVM